MDKKRRFQSFPRNHDRTEEVDRATRRRPMTCACRAQIATGWVHAKRAWLTIEALSVILRRSGMPTHLA
jgi:hypothetical protein